MKVYNFKNTGAAEALMKEMKHVGASRPISSVVPDYISCGMFPATTVPCLVMSDCGEELVLKDNKIPPKLHSAVKKAIRTFHRETACCHHDLHPGNLVQDSHGTVRVIDLASMAPASPAKRKAELAAFSADYM